MLQLDKNVPKQHLYIEIFLYYANLSSINTT
jgi:hypothetical protein